MKVRITEEKLKRIKDILQEDERTEIEFCDENNELIEIWNIEYNIEIRNERSIISEDVNEGIVEKDNEEIRKDKEIDNIDRISEEELNMTEESEKEENVIIEESEEEIISENFQILVNGLKKIRGNIDERILIEDGDELSLKQICQRIRRKNQLLLEDYYYLGKKIGEKIRKEVDKRRTKQEKRRKTDNLERKKVYKIMLNEGLNETLKGVKKMAEKGEKVYRLIEGIGKEKLNSMCNITMVDNCNVKEIEEAIRYFNN
jgi:hypothetical protein